MSILTAHKILITTAIIFFLFYAVWEIRNYPDPGGMGHFSVALYQPLPRAGSAFISGSFSNH